MKTVARSIGRFVGYYLAVFLSAAFCLAVIWVVAVHLFPALFERVKAFVEFLVGVDAAYTVVVAVLAVAMLYALVEIAFNLWRMDYLEDQGLSDASLSWFEMLVLAVAIVEGVAIVLLLPGAFGALEKVGSWLPEAGSLGVIGLAAILTIVVGTTIYLGSLLDFSWRSRPGHDWS